MTRFPFVNLVGPYKTKIKSKRMITIMPVVTVNEKINNDSSFTCNACGVTYHSIAELGYISSLTGSMYDRKYICDYCHTSKSKQEVKTNEKGGHN